MLALLSLRLLSELQLPPLSGAQNLPFVQVIWPAELSQQCISATVALQMVEQRCWHSPEPPGCGWDLPPQRRKILSRGREER